MFLVTARLQERVECVSLLLFLNHVSNVNCDVCPVM